MIFGVQYTNVNVNVNDFCEYWKMLLGTQNQNHANIAASKGGTDFSIAAIMARGSSSREPSERSLSELHNCFDFGWMLKNIFIK